ncbi:MAG: thioesterase family protein [Burkholderiales bacterium]
MSKPVPHTRAAYRHFQTITTRWLDNDAYGHVNNTVFYTWFDTVVNTFLIQNHVLDIEKGAVIGLVVETQCNYFSPVTYPDTVHAGLRVSKLGNSSVRYEVGIFRNHDNTSCAQGHLVHVYVGRLTRKAAHVPVDMRKLLQTILAP